MAVASNGDVVLVVRNEQTASVFASSDGTTWSPVGHPMTRIERVDVLVLDERIPTVRYRGLNPALVWLVR